MAKKGVLVAALTVLILSGCTENEPGQASGDDSPGSSSAPSKPSSGSATPTVAIPPRPEDLKLDGVDPCKLLTAQQLTELKVRREPRAIAPSGTQKLPGCAYEITEGTSTFTMDVVLYPAEGIEPWLSGKRNVEADLVSVGGFPAVNYRLRGQQGSTAASGTTAVSVGQNQHFEAAALLPPRSFTQEQLYQITDRVAGMVLTTLKTLR